MRKATLFTVPKSEFCPLCGAELIIRSGKYGTFQGCSHYPLCNFIRPLRQQADGHVVKVLEGQCCPRCQSDLVLRQGRYGMFISCSCYPECEYTDAIDQSDITSIPCPQCQNGILIQRRSRYGKIFHGCDKYPGCRFAVNFTPVEGTCNFCQFSLLIEKKTAHGMKRFCASKVCGKAVITGSKSE
ncbi:topoisomerase DNA-binding C4 zinc finger domain-containing protein [Enterobacteriaceae bacterium LUAb1]